MAGPTAEDAIAAIVSSMSPGTEPNADLTEHDDADSYDDPLLDQLHHTHQEIRTAQRRLRLLLAYAREFQGRRPYPFSVLADAAGMSASGVRTAYDGDDVQRVAEILGVPIPSQPRW